MASKRNKPPVAVGEIKWGEGYISITSGRLVNEGRKVEVASKRRLVGGKKTTP